MTKRVHPPATAAYGMTAPAFGSPYDGSAEHAQFTEMKTILDTEDPSYAA